MSKWQKGGWQRPANPPRGGRNDQYVEILHTLTLNVVHERKNLHVRVPFSEVTNYGVAEGEPKVEIPDDYRSRRVEKEFPYDRFMKLLEDKCGYDPYVDRVDLHNIKVSPDVGGGAELYKRDWGCEPVYIDCLWLITSGFLAVPKYSDVQILITEAKPIDRAAEAARWEYRMRHDTKREGEPDTPTSSSSEEDWNTEPPEVWTIEELRALCEFEKENQKTKPQFSDISDTSEDEWGYPKGGFNWEKFEKRRARRAAEKAWANSLPSFDKSKIHDKKDFVPKASKLPRPPRSPSPASGDDGGPGPSRFRPTTKDRLAPPSRRGAAPRPSRSDAARDQSQTSIKLQLIEDRAQYETEDAQDDDYGAIDQTVIDTYVGAYNTGDSDRSWDTCLSFFNIDPEEWARQEELRYKTAANAGAARKRVPMKKLPGMTIGLFDYQLIGVLNLLRNVLWNVPGGLLADEQGLGKTQEMFGVIALAYNLRRSKTEVKAEWKSGKRSQHNPPRDPENPGEAPRACKTDDRWGFRCYCYNGLTQMLADSLPEGPNFIIGPERSAQQIYREGKSKLDTKVLKLRLEHDAAAPEERLTAREIKALGGKITATGDNTFEYHANAGQSEYIIISHPGQLNKLAQGSFGVNVKTSAGAVVKKSAFLPGIILMDEFHEFTSAAPQGHETRTVQWLKHLKQNHPPLVYFVSGTPFGDSPADIRAAIDMFDNPNFHAGINERLPGTTLAEFDELVTTFDDLLARQNGGEALPLEEHAAYRKLLNKFLGCMMVRRLGVDKFRGRNLTDIGPLSVKITDHPAPPSLISSLQDLANSTRGAVNAALPATQTLGNFLRSQSGADLLLKLRLASTFPGIATPLPDGSPEFTFTPSEIGSFLSKAKGDLTKTPYYKYIPTWSAYSPKITTILATVNQMISDKSKIPGEATSTKKLIIFSPLEAESMLIYGYLLLKKQKDKNIKPAWINSVQMDQKDRGKVIDKFLVMGNGPPNILVAPMSLAGTGLNLQKVKYSIITSPAWSKRENQQAYYRVHRVGQVQDTKLSLLTGRWDPAERVVLKKYEGQPVDGAEEDIWGVGDEFAHQGEEGKGKGLVDRHQVVKGESR